MKIVEIKGEAKIKFHQSFAVTDKEYDVLVKKDEGREVDSILESRIDPDDIQGIDDFYIYDLKEIDD